MKTKLLTIVLAFVGCTLALAQDEVTENGYGDFLRAVFMNNRFYDEVLSIGDHGYFDGVKAYDKDKYTEAIRFFSQDATECHQNIGYDNHALTYVYMSIGKPDLAIAAANIAIEKLPSDKKELLAQTYFARSFAYLALQDTTARIADLTQAIALTPDEMLYYKVRASDYSNMGQYAEADRDFDKMIELDEGFIHAYIGKGHILLKQQQYEEAIKVFEYVTKLDPTYAYGYGFLATAYSWLGRDQEALDNIMLALQINYDRWALNFMMNAALGPYKTDVIARFKTMSLKEPQNAYWDYYTGHVYLAHEEYAQALEAFKAAYEKDPDKEIARWIAECQAKLEK